MAIVLRKVAGKLTPMLRPAGGVSFGTGAPASSIVSILLSPLVLMILALAFCVAWALSHGGIHPHSLLALPVIGETALLAEKNNEYAAKSKKFDDVTKMITAPEDYGKKDVLDLLGATDIESAKDKIKAAAAELEALGRDVDMLNIEDYKRKNAARLEQLNRPIRPAIAGSSSMLNEVPSFGEMVTGSKSWMGSRTPVGTRVEVQLGDHGIKTLLQTSAGWQPRTDNGTVVVDKIIRPVQVLDLFPSDRTELFEIPSMEETTRTQAAAELAEAGTYAEDAFAFTRRTSPVKKVGSEIPVTDEQLDDVPGLNGLLNNRLTFGLRARADQQIVVGDGTGSTLTGLANASNVQTQAKAADPTANAVLKAITLVRVSGRAAPTHVFMHGTDIQNLRLAQNAMGDYQFGPPYASGESSIWGLPWVQTEALTQGTALVVSMNPLWVCLYYRKDIEVQVGYINDQFIKGQKTLRADMRIALWVGRGQAFCKVTGL